MRKIETLGKRVQLKIDEPKAGSLDVTSLNVAKETGEVVGIGKDVDLTAWPIKVGDRVMFKAWAVDICTENGEKFYFISQPTDGLCGKILQ